MILGLTGTFGACKGSAGPIFTPFKRMGYSRLLFIKSENTFLPYINKMTEQGQLFKYGESRIAYGTSARGTSGPP